MHWTALPSIAIFATLLAIIVWNSIRTRRRSAEIAAMAGRLGLHRHPSNLPPGGLSFEGTEFGGRAKLSDLHVGTLRGRPVAFFNVFKHAGKGGWSRTVIAVCTPHPIALRPPTELQVHTAGDWKLLYIPKGFINSEKLLHAAQIEDILGQVTNSPAPAP